jgi:hypothetical protein
MVKEFTRLEGSERNYTDCSRGFEKEVDGYDRKGGWFEMTKRNDFG